MTKTVGRIEYWTEGLPCCNGRWEEAYTRFETPEEEIAKFRKRLIGLGVRAWRRDARIADLFCGSGRNLVCLDQLGFTDLRGVDLSPHLLMQYQGPASLFVGDATALKFEDESLDAVIVQGGLHHLPRVPEDLEQCLGEMQRVLVPRGRVVIVEPWLTPFLRLVHYGCGTALLTALWPKLDALRVMIEEERDTYLGWLSKPKEIQSLFLEYFEAETLVCEWGKISFIGKKA